MWCEDVKSAPRERLELLEMYKRSGHLHVQVFDAESGFYAGSISIPMKSFDRAPHARAFELPVDIALQWDTTVASAGAGGPGSSLPVDGSSPQRAIGTVHLTTCGIGFDLPSVHADASSANAGAVRRVVEVKRLPGSLFDDAGPGPTPEASAKGGDAAHVALRNLPPEQRNLHEQRARFLKQALLAGKTKQDARATAGADRVEMDLRMKLVERKREELKATRIAEHLRSRITRRISTTVARGAPRTVRSAFVNPYTSPMSFKIELPSTSSDRSKPRLRHHSATGSVLDLGPRQESTVSFVVEHDIDRVNDNIELQAHVLNDRGELVLIILVDVTTAGPLISRRLAVFGEAGSVQFRTVFFRSFSGGVLGIERSTPEELLAATANVASWPQTSSQSVRAESIANVDPVARGYAAAWETVTLECKIPSHGSHEEALVHFYATNAAEKHLETWALDISPCTTATCEAIPLGQTTVKQLQTRSAGAIDKCFAFSGTATATPAMNDSQPAVSVAVKPVVEGKQTLLVHAYVGDVLERIVLSFVATLPEPTHYVALSIKESEAAYPVHRRIPVENSTTALQTLHLSTNYREHATLSHTKIEALQPGERKYATLTLRGLGTGMRHPVYVFINDDRDISIACHLIDVTVDSSVDQ